MVTAESPFQSSPRISEERFVSVLEEVGSPWAGQASRLYRLIRDHGHDPAVWLAICGREHSFGTNQDSVLHRNRTNSWTNARSVRLPGIAHEIIHDAVRGGPYVRYRSVEDSLRDGMFRVADPDYVYRRSGATSIGAVLALWTESDSAGYTGYVARMINEWRDGDGPYARAISGLVDARQELARRDAGDGVPAGPFEQVPLADKQGLVVHYSGPPVRDRASTVTVLQSEAHYHVGKNWARPGSPAVYGDGLMYHVAIGADGLKYLCRDLEAALWHCGVTSWNRRALSVHLPLGGNQRATDEQLNALTEVANDWLAFTGSLKDAVRGHRELSPTSCPGTLMEDFVYPYREGAPVASGQWFDVTGHYVGGAFWTFWREQGGLPIFGYPLTDEREETCEDGRTCTVQYFERAVFEWRPDYDPPHQVQLRRLGAGALERV